MVYQGADLDPTLPPAVAGPAFLRDGTEVWVRPAQSSDRDLVLDLLERESPDALKQRYFSALRPGRAGEELLAPSVPEDRLCLLVLGDRSDRVVVLGVGEYARLGPGSSVAEVAFLVGAPYRGRGIATLLLARLARAALAFGIRRFEARIRAENPEMLEVFRGSGLPFTEETGEDEVDVLIPLAPDAGASGAGFAGDRGPVARPAQAPGASARPPPLPGRLRAPVARSRP
jgi:acetyltransferase